MTEWNAPLQGDYLRTNMMVGEVFPTAVTPSTWSVWGDFFDNLSLGDIPSIECIPGRPYVNYSLTYSFLLKLVRKHERVMGVIEDSIGVPPDGVDIPLFPISMKNVILKLFPREFRHGLIKGRLKKNASEFLVGVRKRCLDLEHQVEETKNPETLIGLWVNDIRPMWKEIHLLQDGMNESLHGLTGQLKGALAQALGIQKAQAVLTTISGGAGEIASLGPLVGLSGLRHGKISRDEYLTLYGHRGPHENELAEPRPYEDPDWLDRELAGLARSPVDVTDMLERRRVEFTAVREDVEGRLPPSRARAIARQIDEMVEVNTVREATRSELTRIVRVIRHLFLRAGELAGLGDGVFFLTVGELIDVLSGDVSASSTILSRRHIFERFQALPPLPAWIRGPFDPFQWAADPKRRMDVYDPHVREVAAAPKLGKVIQGFPGSAGCAEGMVRRIDSPEQGDELRPGEILVTSTTNIGWTRCSRGPRRWLQTSADHCLTPPSSPASWGFLPSSVVPTPRSGCTQATGCGWMVGKGW